VKKTTLIIASLVAVIVASFSFTPDVLFENLQVLPKDTNKYQLDSVMEHFNTSLGVNCNFCHFQENNAMKDWNFASDSLDNKKIAREMLKMTYKINRDDFGITNAGHYGTRLEVSCYTCHHGKTHPQRFPKPAPATRQ